MAAIDVDLSSGVDGAAFCLPMTENRTKQPTPTVALEAELWSRGVLRVAGVDEVGRGCLAGPVVAAACVLPPGVEEIVGVRDSKELSAPQRRQCLVQIQRYALAIGIGAASCREIERYNIRVASTVAMRRALAHLGVWDHALCDGPLGRELDPERHSGIVNGDAVSLSVACASIVAKVTRDDLMARLARRHPQYGWDHNVGYPSREHIEALKRYGVTPHHRRTFAPVRDLLLA